MTDRQSNPQPPNTGQPPEPERMTHERAIELLKTDVKAWNEWRKENPEEELSDLQGADLSGANLSGADLSDADLSAAYLSRADLRCAYLSAANLYGADLSGADLRDADLTRADLSGADLRDADLSGADLWSANLSGATLDGSDLSQALANATVFAELDLTSVRGLESITHYGPSTVGTNTLIASRGRIPAEFLRGCGLQPWEIEAARLYDPALTAGQINDIQYKIFALRTRPLFLGGIFISYSHDDMKFVDKLYDRLINDGANVWLDRHDMLAGDLEKQVDRAIRLNDVVVLVLSKSSVESDWVEYELEKARKKEKDEKRDVLCPVTLDDAWKAKMDERLWRQVKKKNVLDFSKFKTKAFETPFAKLIKGLRINFTPDDADASASAPDDGSRVLDDRR